MSLNTFKSQSGLEICTLFKPSTSVNSNKILIYLNGLTQTISSWGAQSQVFSSVAHQLFYDIPGQGRSSKLTQPFSLQQQAEVLHELIQDTLDHNIAIQTQQPFALFFIGFSFGSRVLFEYLWQQKKYPQAQLAGVIVVGSSYKYAAEQVTTFNRWRNLLEVIPPNSEEDTMKNFFKQVLPDTLGATYLNKNAHLFKFMEGAFLQRNSRQNLCFLLDSITQTSTPPTSAFTYPCLLIRGAQDPLCLRSNLESLQQFFPHSQIVEIPAAGHTVAIEKAAEFNQIVLNYIQENP